MTAEEGEEIQATDGRATVRVPMIPCTHSGGGGKGHNDVTSLSFHWTALNCRDD